MAANRVMPSTLRRTGTVSNMKQRRIWKWTLAVTDKQSLQMPKGAKILTVQEQGGMPQLWAYCDPTEPLETRTFRIVGTGNPIDQDPGDYIGTFQMRDGALVFHVFEAL